MEENLFAHKSNSLSVVYSFVIGRTKIYIVRTVSVGSTVSFVYISERLLGGIKSIVIIFRKRQTGSTIGKSEPTNNRHIDPATLGIGLWYSSDGRRTNAAAIQSDQPTEQQRISDEFDGHPMLVNSEPIVRTCISDILRHFSLWQIAADRFDLGRRRRMNWTNYRRWHDGFIN